MTLLAACGGGGKKSARPCGVGIDVAGCGTDVRTPSVWGETIRTSHTGRTGQTDAQTQKESPGSEKLINVAYEFIPGQPARWRRTITVDSAEQSLAMFQEGTVLEITGATLKLAVDRSSCDGATPDRYTETIYYRRVGGSLEIDTQPIAPPTKNKFLIDGLMADMVGKMMTATIRQGLETAFSFGSVRTYLTSGHGSLSARTTDLRALAQAKWVCFNGLGPGFADSDLRPSW